MTIWLSQGLKVPSRGSIVSTFAAAIVSSYVKLPTGSDLRRLSLVSMPSKPKVKASCRSMGGRNLLDEKKEVNPWDGKICFARKHRLINDDCFVESLLRRNSFLSHIQEMFKKIMLNQDGALATE